MFGRKRIGLALGSGGTRGFAHIGVLKVLHNEGIPIDVITGSSVGSLVGGIYAVNQDLKVLEALVTDFPYVDMLGALFDPTFAEGLTKGEKFTKLLAKYVGDTLIENTKIPFAAVASNKVTGEAVLLDSGSLVEAMRASSSMPVIFTPFKKDDSELLDGGVCEQVPVNAAKALGADKVIAVNLSEKIQADFKNELSKMQHYLLLLFKTIARANVADADIILSPFIASSSWIDNVKNRVALVEEGERCALEVLPEIKKLQRSGWFS